LQADAVGMLEKENEVRIAEVSWLSREDRPKACGTMVVNDDFLSGYAWRPYEPSLPVA